VATAIGQTDFSPLGGPRTQVTGPPFRQLDMSLSKRFNLSRMRLEFRAEAYNLTNTPSFNLPSSTNFANKATFGLITPPSNSARQIHLAAKLHW